MSGKAVYLASRYSRRVEMLGYADALDREGYRVTSRWILGNHQAENDQLQAGAAAEQFAREDLADLEAAQIVLAFTEEPRATSSRGGRHVEFGYALGQGKLIIIVGPRENVFCCLAEVQRVDSFEDALPLLSPSPVSVPK